MALKDLAIGCASCKYWDRDNARPFMRSRTIHRFRWTKCMRAPLEWDRFNDEQNKMAVWTGGNTYAELITRNDHTCGLYEPRALSPNPDEPTPSVEEDQQTREGKS